MKCKDDIRRVTSNWREYAGIVSDGRAKDLNPNMIEDPTGILYDTGRAVFDMELLHRVATVQEKRSTTKRPRGSVRKAHTYALSRLLYCPRCEELALKHENPKLRLRLGGHNMRGTLRRRTMWVRNPLCAYRSD